jgi:6-phosphogluconate dehydrogenase (decarboxylating)
MELGIVGLGRRGVNMTALVLGGHKMISLDRTAEAIQRVVKKGLPAPVLMLSLFARFASRQDGSFAAKIIAALRNELGGHAVKRG